MRRIIMKAKYMNYLVFCAISSAHYTIPNLSLSADIFGADAAGCRDKADARNPNLLKEICNFL